MDLPTAANKSLLKLGKETPDICPWCKVNFVKWYQSKWTKFCGRKCATKFSHSVKGKEILEKRKKTLFKKYGFENASQSLEVKEKKKKTTLENYGVENPSQSKEIQNKKVKTSVERYGVGNPMQNPLIKSRGKKTMLERYGVENPSQSKEIQEKKIRTSLERYGVPYPMQSEKVMDNLRASFMKRYGVPYPMLALKIRLKNKGCRYPEHLKEKLTNKNFWDEEYSNKGKSLSQIAFELGISNKNILNYFYACGLELKEISGSSSEELELKTYISSFGFEIKEISFGELAKEFGLEDNLLSRKKLDIYIPELKLAFEYNGIYWHSEDLGKYPKYHLEKSLECERLGIRLIHIWSDDWMLNRKLMEKKIKNILGKDTEKIFARKCKIVLNPDKVSFYEENHIKGNGGGSLNIGLTLEGKLVSCITFRDMGNGVWDLNRYASSLNVVGGFSKLLAHFKRNNRWTKIYTFADRSWSQGNVYLKSGFNLVGEVPPGFHGIERGKRINRHSYTHKKLSKKFPELKESNLSQLEIMRKSGIPVIWDCGQLKFEVNNLEIM